MTETSAIEKVCCFCHHGNLDKNLYGDFYHDDVNNLSCHTFCLYFSSGLNQSNEDTQFDGFSPAAIKKEISRSRRLKCKFCEKFNASIGCCVGSCSAKYHYICGRQKSVLFEHFDTFRSWCQKHRPPPAHVPDFTTDPLPSCVICLTDLSATDKDVIVAACCAQNSVFHQNCIQTYAVSSGKYAFKCPVCNNVDHFQADMLAQGIHIPDKDADWELVPDAFNELRQPPARCHHKRCKCPQGPAYDDDDGVSPWDIVMCNTCGATGCHRGCQYYPKNTWTCIECKDILRKVERNLKKRRLEELMEGQKKNKDDSNRRVTTTGAIERQSLLDRYSHLNIRNCYVRLIDCQVTQVKTLQCSKNRNRITRTMTEGHRETRKRIEGSEGKSTNINKSREMRVKITSRSGGRGMNRKGCRGKYVKSRGSEETCLKTGRSGTMCVKMKGSGGTQRELQPMMKCLGRGDSDLADDFLHGQVTFKHSHDIISSATGRGSVSGDLGHTHSTHGGIRSIDPGHSATGYAHTVCSSMLGERGHQETWFHNTIHVLPVHTEPGCVGNDTGHDDVGHADVGHADVGHANVGHDDVGHDDVGHDDVEWGTSGQCDIHHSEASTTSHAMPDAQNTCNNTQGCEYVHGDNTYVHNYTNGDSRYIHEQVYSDSTQVHEQVYGDSTQIHEQVYGDSTQVHEQVYSDSTQVREQVYSDSTQLREQVYGDSTQVHEQVYSDSKQGPEQVYCDSKQGPEQVYGDSKQGPEQVYGDSKQGPE